MREQLEPPRESENPPALAPLCVDLDGTLIRSDLLIESLLSLLRKNVFFLFLLPLWLFGGKAALNQQVAERVELDVSRLPYNDVFLGFLREEKRRGRVLVLATASNQKYAAQVADHLDLFDHVWASDAAVNLSGHAKAEKIVAAFGEGGFDYAGNSRADLLVWRRARCAIAVNVSDKLCRQAQALSSSAQRFESEPVSLAVHFNALRTHQWLKNLLLFVPLIMAHEVKDTQLLMQASLAFLSFCLCASSVYLPNDLLDLSTDRRHPVKCNRAIASGRLPIGRVIVLIPALLGLGIAVALALPAEFLAVLLLYYATTLAYSLFFRRMALVDVMVLAGLYAVRVLAGGVATSIGLSFWLLGFSIFLFLSLALLKRYSDLLLTDSENLEQVTGRGYRTGDIEGLAQSGLTSGYMSVLVLAFYINSEQVVRYYVYPELIWLLCPLLLFWINRVWLLARRGEVKKDPVLFALEDRVSYCLGFAGVLILWLAS